MRVQVIGTRVSLEEVWRRFNNGQTIDEIAKSLGVHRRLISRLITSTYLEEK